MLSSLGHTFLLVAFIVALYSVFATVVAFRIAEPRRASMLQSAHRSTVAVFWLLSLACLVVIYGFPHQRLLARLCVGPLFGDAAAGL
jgi:cytochrome c biogenesis factor